MMAVMDDLSTERSVDLAIANAEEGDTIWLVSPALQTDDDKTATGEVMWRFRPWHTMAIARPVSFEYKDYRYGQPRSWNQVTLHSSTELDEAAFDHVATASIERGATVWLVLYDHGPATGLDKRILRTLEPYEYSWQWVGADRGLGVDGLARIEGVR